ncbi:MAG: hypothetical protein ACC656_11870, partial [Candidatus Heimdallarchaeota archaeon]
ASILNMKTGRSHNEILQLGLVNGLLMEKDTKLHFTNNRDKVMKQFMEIVEDLSIKPVMTQDFLSDDNEQYGGFGFDGGKIVFVNASNDLERSPFEDQEKNKK